MDSVTADIINIGDELLIGQVVNTNASWIASELNKHGIAVNEIKAIGDDGSAIESAIVGSNANILLITGGLGPTRDDITKKVLCNFFGSNLIFHEPTFKHIVELFGKRNYTVSPVNKAQALIPATCIPIFNAHGTAPGMWFENKGKVVVSMPGVPFEMMALVSDKVIPMIEEKFDLGTIYHRTVMTAGVGESKLAERIADWENELPDYIKLAYLPQPGIVRLRLSSRTNLHSGIEKEIDEQIAKLTKLIPEIIFGYDDILLEEVVAELLKVKGFTISTAESCTGGYISHLITSVAGSSEYFMGSIVSYSNDVKVRQLGVDERLIEKHGVVSAEVVEQMALGGKQVLKTDCCIATSGIAGPDGGTPDKPVGTVWIAVATPDNKVLSKLFYLGEHRGRNIRRAALLGLDMLRRVLI